MDELIHKAGLSGTDEDITLLFLAMFPGAVMTSDEIRLRLGKDVFLALCRHSSALSMAAAKLEEEEASKALVEKSRLTSVTSLLVKKCGQRLVNKIKSRQQDQQAASRPPPKVIKRKRQSLPQAVRWQCWNQHIGEDNAHGPCFCCGRRISMQVFDCGHMIPASQGGGNDVANLRPICRTCNLSMHDTHMMEFKNAFGLSQH